MHMYVHINCSYLYACIYVHVHYLPIVNYVLSAVMVMVTNFSFINIAHGTRQGNRPVSVKSGVGGLRQRETVTTTGLPDNWRVGRGEHAARSLHWNTLYLCYFLRTK